MKLLVGLINNLVLIRYHFSHKYLSSFKKDTKSNKISNYFKYHEDEMSNYIINDKDDYNY